jgi:ABC-type transport system involved in multi-copper enzyme maturation permease subunit
LRIQAWKEMRALLPWWAGGTAMLTALGALSSAPGRHPPPFSAETSGVLVYFATASALGALAVGHEYSGRTLAATLAQPVTRARILLTKYGVLAVLLLGLMGVNRWADLHPAKTDYLYDNCIGPLLGLCLAPWLSMVSRSALAGGVLGVVLVFIALLVTESIGLESTEFFWPIGGMAAAGFWLSWRTFLRLEVIEGSEARPALPEMRRPARAARPGLRRRRLELMVHKELRLQRLTFVCAGLYLAVWSARVAWRWISPDHAAFGPPVHTVNTLFMVLVALTAGAQPLAAERQFGTTEWPHLLPGAEWRIWALKVGIAIGLAIALGIGLPTVLAAMQPAHDDAARGGEVLVAVLLTVTGVYVSTLATSGVRALLASIMALAVMHLLMTWILSALQGLGPVLLGLSRRLVEAGIGPSPVSNRTLLEPRSHRPRPAWADARLSQLPLAQSPSVAARIARRLARDLYPARADHRPFHR